LLPALCLSSTTPSITHSTAPPPRRRGNFVNRRPDAGNWLLALCSLLFALCSSPSAPCSLPFVCLPPPLPSHIPPHPLLEGGEIFVKRLLASGC
jgi:hypothetical protein